MSQQPTTKLNSKKLIVITGASSGIGEECVRYFNNSGYSVLALARRVDKMKNALGKLKNVMIEKVDVTNYKQFKNAIDKAEKEYGATDCLINNAGVMLLDTMINQPINKWDLMIDVNVKGVLNGIKAVLEGMKSRKSGTIINISSMAGKKHFDNHTVYCSTKFAVQAITEGVRQEMAEFGVKVTVICPGVVETELMTHNKDSKNIYNDYNKWKETLTEGSLLPKDIADACLYVYKLPKRCCIREIQIAPTSQKP